MYERKRQSVYECECVCEHKSVCVVSVGECVGKCIVSVCEFVCVAYTCFCASAHLCMLFAYVLRLEVDLRCISIITFHLCIQRQGIWRT